MSLIIAFSGQGSQHSVMLKWLSEDSFGYQWIKEASVELNLDLFDERVVQQACMNVVQVQCLIVLLSVGTFYVLEKSIDLKPAFLCGYSLGEISAFCVSAQLNITDICKLVTHRAVCMQNDVTQPSGMAVLKGNINLIQVTELITLYECYLAIINAPDHYIIGGLITNLNALLIAAKKSGVIKVDQLPINLPSHTPLLKQATNNFAEYADVFLSQSMRYPILNALTLDLIFNTKEMLPILAKELSQPLYWNKVMSITKEYGASLFLELGPGAALKNMATTHNPQLPAYHLEGFRSLNGLIVFLRKRRGC